MLGIGRREFITLLGGAAAAWPLAARAQQPAMPVVGFLSGQSPHAVGRTWRGVSPGPEARPAMSRAATSRSNTVGRKDSAIDCRRWRPNWFDRQVAVIVGDRRSGSALAAKAATATIPIVFNSGGDPVKAGLVASLNRPGGNVTGISWFNAELAAKRLELLHELVPGADIVALLVNPSDPDAGAQMADVQEAARVLGRQVASSMPRPQAKSMPLSPPSRSSGPRRSSSRPIHSYLNRRDQIIALAAHHAVPTIYSNREFITAGGLMSYGNNLPDAYRRKPASTSDASSRAKAGRPAGRAADQIRAGHQSQDRQGARSRRAAVAARPRRRGDRMSAPGKAGAIQPVEVRPK